MSVHLLHDGTEREAAPGESLSPARRALVAFVALSAICVCVSLRKRSLCTANHRDGAPTRANASSVASAFFRRRRALRALLLRTFWALRSACSSSLHLGCLRFFKARSQISVCLRLHSQHCFLIPFGMAGNKRSQLADTAAAAAARVQLCQASAS